MADPARPKSTDPESAGPPPPPPAAERPAPLTQVSGLSCPNCAGTLDVAGGLRVVSCEYCETPLLALEQVGIRRFAVEPRVDASRARKAAQEWLASGWNKDRRLKTAAETEESFLCFLPFFRIQADALGVALGTERRTRTVGSGKNRRTVTEEVDVERVVEKSLDRTYPAVHVAEWGIRKVDLTGDRIVPFEQAALETLGMVFPPTSSELAVRQAALEEFKAAADPVRGLHKVRFRFLETLRERLSVIYYPLWIVRYRFADRSYQVLVDAEDGSISYGKAPGNDFFRASMLVLSEAAAAFLATTALQTGVGAFMLFAGVASIALLAWGWKRFRHGGVVIEGTGVEAGPSLASSIRVLSESPEDVLRKLASGSGLEIG